jgi:hypothetical protein
VSNLVRFDSLLVGELSYIKYTPAEDPYGNVSSHHVEFELRVHNASAEAIHFFEGEDVEGYFKDRIIHISILTIPPSFHRLVEGVFLQSYKINIDSDFIDAVYIGMIKL